VARPDCVNAHRSGAYLAAVDGQDQQQVQRVLNVLRDRQHERVAAIVLLARTTGMRLREAILADLPRLRREAERLGRINIQDGTKGGRAGAFAARCIRANEEVKAALRFARDASPLGSRNLLSSREGYAAFLQQTVRPARELLHEQGLKGLH
jgi:hypothetical protein